MEIAIKLATILNGLNKWRNIYVKPSVDESNNRPKFGLNCFSSFINIYSQGKSTDGPTDGKLNSIDAWLYDVLCFYLSKEQYPDVQQ